MAVAVYAVFALAVIGACLAKIEGVGWGGDLGVDGQREAGEEEGGLEHDCCVFGPRRWFVGFSECWRL